MTKVNRFLSLNFDTKPRVLEKIYTTTSSDKITMTSSEVPFVKIFTILTNKIIKEDMARDQKTPSLVWKLDEIAPNIFNIM